MCNIDKLPTVIKKFTDKLYIFQFTADADFPSDAQLIQKIKLLLDNGFADKILISQDIHTKHRMVCKKKKKYEFWLNITVIIITLFMVILLFTLLGLLWRSRVWSHSTASGSKNGGQGNTKRHCHSTDDKEPTNLADI